MHDQHVEYVMVACDRKRPGDFVPGALGGDAEHGGRMAVTAPRDLVRDAAHLEHVRLCLEIGDERADAGDPLDEAFVVQLAQRPIRRHAGHAGGPDKLVLRGNTVARFELTSRDLIDDHFLELLIAGFRLRSQTFIPPSETVS
jgi:hypothetical protein